jgi:hypothetical protein
MPFRKYPPSASSRTVRCCGSVRLRSLHT